ncbi:MAG: single-stranded DNA-binding protein [bacterium TMED88]|nr:MAG: single-stranded DNA-binding protein [bacterium TMED88]
MTRNTFVTEQPVVLEGYQAVMKPTKFGYTLMAIVSQDIIDKLEDDRPDLLKWIESKLKNPKRSVLKPEPWEEVSEGRYRVKFSWKVTDAKPPVVDTEGTLITDENLPIYSGSKVKLAFFQKPYSLPDGTYGTSLKLKGIQVVSLSSSAGVDVGDMSDKDVIDLFGTTAGYKATMPNVIPSPPSSLEEDDADF